MRISSGKAILVAVAVFLIATGCVSNKRHNRDVNALQSQLNTVASEVARIDAQPMTGVPGPSVAASARPAHKGAADGFVSSVVYRTPSGFELPAANIQQALKNAGYYDGETDGKVGPKTRDAIRAFQKDNGLNPDGVCGKKTWDKLQSHLGSGAIK